MEQHKIVHICHRSDWEAARRAGVYRADSLEMEGFIHCSQPEQVEAVIERFYAGQPDLVLLWIDPDRLQVEARWEAADGALYPHVYGPVALEAVTAWRRSAQPGEFSRSGRAESLRSRGLA